MTKQTIEQNQLASGKQLIMASLCAMLVAAMLLITVVLPAEYGIDATGIGKALGLTQMGEIKNQLAAEAAADLPNDQTKSLVKEKADQNKSIPESPTIKNNENVDTQKNTARHTVILKPGEAAEIKLSMNKGDKVDYAWQVDTGHVNYDTHGDNPKLSYYGYNKGKKSTGDQGTLTAAFDGKHGWFWRNRWNSDVTVSLQVDGEFNAVIRVL